MTTIREGLPEPTWRMLGPKKIYLFGPNGKIVSVQEVPWPKKSNLKVSLN